MTNSPYGNAGVIPYLNNRAQWPDKDLWDRLRRENDDKHPANEQRCQYITGVDDELGAGNRCGLPCYAGEKKEARCILHYSGERSAADLLKALEGAVSSGACLFHANLSWAYLTHANLDGAKLRWADLSAADLWHANLSWAQLRGANLMGADLRRASLGAANLSDANLGGADLEDANLTGAHLDRADLMGANLRRAGLDGARLGNADLRGADLRLAKLTGDIDLRHADLRRARFLDFELSPEAKLDGAQWGEGATVQDETDARKGQGPDGVVPSFDSCAAIYRQIKTSYQESGHYQIAGRFFVREMECRRSQIALTCPDTWWQRLVWWLGRSGTWLSMFLMRHAEGPGRLLLVMALLLVLFAGLHSLSGVVDNTQGTTDQPQYVLAPGWGLGLSGDPLVQLGKALYFSIITFTSLGYGDVQPTKGWGQFFVALEAVVGVILIALFVGCIIRRVSR